MNDCVFNFIGCCDCHDYKCPKYISINSSRGEVIDETFTREVEKVVTPIVERFKKEYMEK